MEEEGCLAMNEGIMDDQGVGGNEGVLEQGQKGAGWADMKERRRGWVKMKE